MHDLDGAFALGDARELHAKRTLALLGRQHGVRRQLRLDGGEVISELLLDVDDGRCEERLDLVDEHATRAAHAGDLLDVRGDEVVEARQLEVPVAHLAHLGRLARERGFGRDEVDRIILMAQVALVGVGLLGFAALHRATPDDLTAVEEGARLRIVELRRGELLEPAVIVEARDEGVGHLLLLDTGKPDAASLEDVEADVVGVERGLLRVVVHLHVVGDGPVEVAGLDELAVALVDGRAEAIGTAHEQHVTCTDAVAQEAGVDVSRHEDAGDMAKVEALVAVGHARRDDGALGKLGTVVHEEAFRSKHHTNR